MPNMYAAALLSVLIVAAWAGQDTNQQPQPRRCCAEPYYTYRQHVVSTSLYQGALQTEFVTLRGAYDSIEKKIGLRAEIDISNGTVEVNQIIVDYNKQEVYLITYPHAGETKCFTFSNLGGFPYNCLPENSTYGNTVSIGDRALYAANWYYVDNKIPGVESHYVFTKKEEGCVDIGIYQRDFVKQTGSPDEEIKTVRTSFFDYSLGICDPDFWFKPPAECEGQRVKNVKDAPKNLDKIFGPGVRRLFQ